MFKIGITGQSGFIGTHLYNSLNLYPNKFQIVSFDDDYFKEVDKLSDWVQKCDVIVHLAAINRHKDQNTLYKTNISLVNQLIDALERTNSNPFLIFASSSQEEQDNIYGNSKREGRELFEKWASQNKARYTGLIIPNVYGPFGKPFYNSVVATFCYQLTHNEIPQIDIDAELKLIYISELINYIISCIDASNQLEETQQIVQLKDVTCISIIKVSELLNLLISFKELYIESGEIPNITNQFNRNLFNTFLTYIDHKKVFPYKLKQNTDERGSFVETIKLNSGGQISFSTTNPGITRGNHFHTRKTERFAIVKGKALISIRRIGTSEIISFALSGENPSFVDMPIWHTHNIKNIGNDELLTLFWINEHFNSSDIDTFYEQV